MTVCLMYILALAVSQLQLSHDSKHIRVNTMRQHLAIDVRRAIEGFIDYSYVPRGSLLFYGMLNDPTETAKNVVYVLQTIVGDSIVVKTLSSFSCSRFKLTHFDDAKGLAMLYCLG